MPSLPKKITKSFSSAYVYFFSSLDSTNEYLKKNPHEHVNGDVIWALKQDFGKGRHGRSWFSSEGEDLTFSIFLDVSEYDSVFCLYLPMVGALSLVRLLEFYQCFPRIKWPNDILVNHAKLAGILTETIVFKKKKVLYFRHWS